MEEAHSGADKMMSGKTKCEICGCETKSERRTDAGGHICETCVENFDGDWEENE